MQAVNKTGSTRLTRLNEKIIIISATAKVLLYRPLESSMFNSNSNSRPSSSDEIVRKKIANV